MTLCEKNARIFKRIIVDPDTDCLVWDNISRADGYATVSIDYKSLYVHRVMYELFIGPIPKGLVIDHLCRNRSCVNPSHLEAVTYSINTRRGVSKIADNAAKTHCIGNHALSGTNVRMRKDVYTRMCRECERIRLAKYRGKIYVPTL